MAAHEQVEFLVGAAQLQVSLERDRVVALQERIQKLVHADGMASLVALAKVFALHHAGDGVFGRQRNHAGRAQRVAPFAVVAHLGFFGVQHFKRLRFISLGVDFDLFSRERRARGVAARGVADQGGEVADQKNDLMPQILQLAHFVQHHGVAQMDVGRGRV